MRQIIRAFFVQHDEHGVERGSVRHFDASTGEHIERVTIPPHGAAEVTSWPGAVWALRFTT